MLRSTLAAVALVFVALTCRGQTTATAAEPTRSTTIGTVRDGDGNPIVDARVYFAYVPIGGEHLPAADAPEAVTDARGRYRISLLPGAEYRAWAVSPPLDDGTWLVSEVVWTNAAEVIELRAHRAQGNRQIKLNGLDRWAADGPHRVRWLIDDVEAPFEAGAVDAEGMLALPALPANRCTGEVCNASGDVFETFTYDPRNGRESVGIAPPLQLPMRAVDDAGEPVADVEIWERIDSGSGEGHPIGPGSAPRQLWRRLGLTAADGTFAGRIAAARDPRIDKGWHHVTLLGRKAGYAAAFCGFRREPFSNGKEIEREGLERLPFVMRPARPFRGLVGKVGAKAPTLRLCCEARILNKDGDSWINETLMWTVQPDAEGRFEVPDMPTDIEQCYWLPQPGADIAGAFPASVRRSIPPQPLALHASRIDRSKEEPIDLGGFHPVRLQILDQNSGPARGVHVMFLSRNGSEVKCDWWCPRAVPDRAGRLALQLEAGKWLVFARSATAMAHASIEVTADVDLTFELEPMPAMHGTVVDANGRPVADARLNCHSSTHHFGGNAPVLEPIASTLNWRWISAVRTDAEGRFRCEFLDMPNMFFEARFEHGGKQSEDFRIVASEDPQTIVIK